MTPSSAKGNAGFEFQRHGKIETLQYLQTIKTLRECKPAPGRHLKFQSRDHLIRDMSFPICGPLEPTLYLQPFSRHSAVGPNNVNERTQTNMADRNNRKSTCYTYRCYSPTIMIYDRPTVNTDEHRPHTRIWHDTISTVILHSVTHWAIIYSV